MNKKDRQRLERVIDSIGKFPFAHDSRGAKTASLRGMVDFHRDAQVILPLIKTILNGMILESVDTIENALEIGWDYQDPDKTLDKLEQWTGERSASGWEYK